MFSFLWKVMVRFRFMVDLAELFLLPVRFSGLSHAFTIRKA